MLKFVVNHSDITPELAISLFAIDDDGRTFRAYVTREALEGIANTSDLSKNQLLKLAEANIEALSRIAGASFEAGDGYQPTPTEPPYVILAKDDLDYSRETFSRSALDVDFRWA